MRKDLWKHVIVMAALLAAAGMVDAAGIGRSETAPGVPAPPAGLSGDQPEALWPGPDGFGYTGSTCTYQWVDITSTGTEVLLGDDTSAGPFPIGFSFPYYGATYTEFFTASNGYISFGVASSSLSNQCPLPNASTPNDLIALLWDDLDPGDTNDPVYYQTFASCPVGTGQCLVVEYFDFCHYPGGTACVVAGTFEAILYDSGLVRIQFLDAGGEQGSSSTTGMEAANAAADWGLDFSCNTAGVLVNNLCLEMGMVPGINLGPDFVRQPTCPGETLTSTMSLFNNSGTDATFALSYSITSANATISGPPTITVTNGATGNFDVDITPDSGLPNGTLVTGSIGASGAGYSDSSAIDLTADSTVITGWVPVANTTEGVRYHATAYHNGEIYQIGGETGWWTFIGTVRSYDIATNTWGSKAPLPAAVYGTGAVTIGDSIYVVGGSQCTEDPGDGCTAGGFSDAVQIFDTVAGTWSTDAGDPLPMALAYASVVTDGNRIFVIGGQSVAGPVVNTVYIYDPAAASGSRWTTGSVMTTARAFAASAAINGMIYVAGGWTGGTVNIDTVEVYDIVADTWAPGPAMPTVGAPYGSGDLGNFLVAFGSLVSVTPPNSTYSCTVEAYALDTVAGTWTQVADLPRCLYGSEGVSDGVNFFGISGRTNEGGGWHMALENQVSDVCGSIPVELMRFTIE